MDDEMKQTAAKAAVRGFALIDSIADLPHVNCSDTRGRIFHLHSLYDDRDGWQLWIPRPDGKLIPMIAIPGEAMYYSKSPQSKDDFHFGYLDFIHQTAAWEEPSKLSYGILSDLHNLGANLEKIRLIHRHRPPKTRSARLAATELEYIFLVCRSMFDLLQETICNLWGSIDLMDKSLKKKELKRSFAKMVLKDGRPQSSEEIASRFGLPPCFANVYAECGEFLEWLRDYRDRLVHSGTSFDLVFVFDDGFGVSIDKLPFSRMSIWSEKNTRPNNIGSLKSAACHVISNTLKTFDRFTDLLVKNIEWPPPFSPGYGLFVRGHHITELNHVQDGIADSPWYELSMPESES
ncbi:MAG TPA: hypothetical protein VGJ04_03625 [Pirellulales bacterium]|jgi:hypothetical protein